MGLAGLIAFLIASVGVMGLGTALVVRGARALQVDVDDVVLSRPPADRWFFVTLSAVGVCLGLGLIAAGGVPAAAAGVLALAGGLCGVALLLGGGLAECAVSARGVRGPGGFSGSRELRWQEVSSVRFVGEQRQPYFVVCRADGFDVQVNAALDRLPEFARLALAHMTQGARDAHPEVLPVLEATARGESPRRRVRPIDLRPSSRRRPR
jgi:hypothetical protein